jgi:hypothetical protein
MVGRGSLAGYRLLVAGSALLALCGARAALAQPAQAQIDEIVRKAEAKEAEGGFCGTVRWPPGDSWDGFTAHLKAARVGTWKVNTFKNGSCQYDRVTEVHQEGDAKCVSYTFWSCSKERNSCAVGKSTDCLGKDGKLKRR